MFTKTGSSLVLLAIACLALLNFISAIPTNAEEQDDKQSVGTLLERFGIDHDYLSENHPNNNDDDHENRVVMLKRRAMKRKWAKFFQGSESPYAIAFPALIRSRR
ncbi:unnamed protein product [Adineta ricciae]|uniref:Uncharacterized protein n=1 Tax=Adineta ricciae TaxID=249248 RepID=A0A815WYS8_ADIRI|nr:unnamed protein product [Adineta ricciae]